MRARLQRSVDPGSLERVAIHFSRPRQHYVGIPNVLYCHDLPTDPESMRALRDGGWKKFDFFVFVSHWQRDQYIAVHQIPYSKCTVIRNAVERPEPTDPKPSDKIRFIYHTTPHRGLELLVPVFERLSEIFPDKLHLDVFSSFGVYGWRQRDEPYEPIFERIRAHPGMTYHGAVENGRVLDALDAAHVFLYPCIWPETSCIAALEAMSRGVLLVCPNFAALSETALLGPHLLYDFHQDPQAHAQRTAELVADLLGIEAARPGFINSTVASMQVSEELFLETYAAQWTRLLRKLLREHDSP